MIRILKTIDGKCIRWRKHVKVKAVLTNWDRWAEIFEICNRSR